MRTIGKGLTGAMALSREEEIQSTQGNGCLQQGMGKLSGQREWSLTMASQAKRQGWGGAWERSLVASLSSQWETQEVLSAAAGKWDVGKRWRDRAGKREKAEGHQNGVELNLAVYRCTEHPPVLECWGSVQWYLSCSYTPLVANNILQMLNKYFRTRMIRNKDTATAGPLWLPSTKAKGVWKTLEGTAFLCTRERQFPTSGVKINFAHIACRHCGCLPVPTVAREVAGARI